FGHQAGDKTLSAIATILQKFCRRPEDFAARYGGEEFAIVLPHTKNEDSIKIAESVRKAIADSMECRPIEDYQITVSIGVSTMVINTYDVSDFIKVLIEAADKNLYKAKESGRNKIIFQNNIEMTAT
ncbi:MAG: GGDEF domain-containing protein, partial [Spirochaetales bacterium]|nr:GGDEF domain-containing protein [Spirochaetales bacterium]